jgi:hypothetical protein
MVLRITIRDSFKKNPERPQPFSPGFAGVFDGVVAKTCVFVMVFLW